MCMCVCMCIYIQSDIFSYCVCFCKVLFQKTVSSKELRLFHKYIFFFSFSDVLSCIHLLFLTLYLSFPYTQPTTKPSLHSCFEEIMTILIWNKKIVLQKCFQLLCMWMIPTIHQMPKTQGLSNSTRKQHL